MGLNEEWRGKNLAPNKNALKFHFQDVTLTVLCFYNMTMFLCTNGQKAYVVGFTLRNFTKKARFKKSNYIKY